MGSCSSDADSVCSARSSISTYTTVLPLQVMKTWDAAKQVQGYKEELAEHLICHMIRLCPDRNIRQDLGIKSLWSAEFVNLTQSLVDIGDILVTMMGPEVDAFEL